MAVTSSEITAQMSGAGTSQRDQLARLVIEARTYFETDLCRAKLCIQRAADLVQPKLEAGSAAGGLLPRPGALANWQMKKVAAHVELHVAERIRIADLASAVNLSVGYFSRAFSLSFGMPPHVYITQRRILRAEQQMATTTDSLAVIAVDCGMADQSHLCRTFRRVVGMSPGLWRRAAAAAVAQEEGMTAETPNMSSPR